MPFDCLWNSVVLSPQFFRLWTLLAQEDPWGFLRSPMPVMFLLLIMFMVWQYRQANRERDERQKVLDALKKTDRVETIGGIIGVVTSIRPEAGEVTIRTHDDTKIDIKRAAIVKVLVDGTASTTAKG